MRILLHDIYIVKEHRLSSCAYAELRSLAICIDEPLPHKESYFKGRQTYNQY